VAVLYKVHIKTQFKVKNVGNGTKFKSSGPIVNSGDVSNIGLCGWALSFPSNTSRHPLEPANQIYSFLSEAQECGLCPKEMLKERER